MSNKKETNWVFKDDIGSFTWKNPATFNQLYFPVCNEAGMMSSVTPRMAGDAKTGLNSFLMLPVSIEDLHNNRSTRNFWIYQKNKGAYSLTGNSAKQLAEIFTEDDDTDLEIKGEFLSQTLTRNDHKAGISSEITIFCPATDDAVELMRFRITNTTDKAIEITPTAAIPVYGRSADNLRDHRHATSLMHRLFCNDYGIAVKPTIHHDERGHEPNNTYYFVLGAEQDSSKPIGSFPTVEEFIGDEGSFEWPEAVVKNLQPDNNSSKRRDGKEVVGAIRFADTTLKAGETREYIVISGITDDENSILKCIDKYGNSEKYQKALDDNKAFWEAKATSITFSSKDKNFDKWMRWVEIQPTLRKIYGCSFLPHHDYGRGGRGWRDLWQDYLALLLQNPYEAKKILIANFAGVRLDGSNATIILKGIGQFAADRNKIPRVWMDHGVWPYYTTKLYINQTGDIDILFENNTYWKDHIAERAKAVDNKWTPADGNKQKTTDGNIYSGSLFEHMLVQHLTCYFNVGEHGNIKLEDADWNDQLDMAPDRGESVPFTAFYGANLVSMADTLKEYQKTKNVNEISLLKEMTLLLPSENTKTDPASKREVLQSYYKQLSHGISGEVVKVSIDELAQKLKRMGEQLLTQVREHEWVNTSKGDGFFNGYYNNDGDPVDGERPDSIRMNLTAQTFAIMSGAATDEQVASAYKAAGKLLKDANGGYRLTTPLGPNTWNLGRGFALVYGEKETGGMFSHMAVMFTNALYSRNFVHEGYEVLSNICHLCTNSEKSKIYPGVPEYVSDEGRGMYHYITGSASWLLMTVLTQVYGVKGRMGNLVVSPKLVKEQFDENGKAIVESTFIGKKLKIEYINKNGLDYGDYNINNVVLNGKTLEISQNSNEFTLDKSVITSCDEINLQIVLG